jgi:hypothetical protein
MTVGLATVLTSALLVVLPVSTAGAATVPVSNCHDSGPGSLRAAVAGAAGGDVIAVAAVCPPGSPISLTSGPIEISQNITIAGVGRSETAVSGNASSDVFVVDAGVTATISGLTVEDGQVTVTSCVTNCIAAGGAIVNNGTLTITEAAVEGNSVSLHGCTSPCFAEGGAIDNEGKLTIADSDVSGNLVTLTSCTFLCDALGGAIWNDFGATLAITESTLADNQVSGECPSDCGVFGGAVASFGTVTVTRSTVSGNLATTSTLCTNNCASQGGGLFSEGDITVENSTLAGNGATITGCTFGCFAEGGGLANLATAKVDNSTVAGNSAASSVCTSQCGVEGGGIDNGTQVTMAATIVADNTGGDCNRALQPDLGDNLDSDGSCGFSTAFGDLPATNPDLDPHGPQNNGGPTRTIALEPGSPAIDHVAAALCPATDQRGFPRQTPCDIGAYDTDGHSTGSQVRAVVQVHTSPSYAGDPVHIDSSQLQSSCGATVTFESLQGGGVGNVTTGTNSITVILDDDGNATVVVEGSNCAAGTDVVEADLTVAPFLTALTTLVVNPPAVTPQGVSGDPADEVETGNSPSSGDSDVYSVFYVETSPVYAEQTVEISSTQLENRCGRGWRWEPGNGGTEVDGLATDPAGASTTLDDDGNAVFVFAGASCAAGPSAVIADVEAGTHPTYTVTYSITAPQVVTLAAPAGAAGPGAGTKHGTKKHHKHKHKKAGGSTGTPDPPAMTVTASPNPLVETGS